MNKITAKIAPFLFVGVMLVVLVYGVILLSYLLIIGGIVGLVLFLIAWIRDKLFPSQKLTKRKRQQESNGRIIEHDDK